ncbi:MAG: thiamine-phosphate pyrophosphorylase [Actinomycetota bacterium]|nr:thiamine-phosphate pyrophosphorylase [Actinomycetota bacterium]
MRPTVAGTSARSRPLGRLCLVTDHRTGAGILDTVAAGLAGGVDLVQVRPGPDLCDRDAYELTVRAVRLCRARGVPCLVDDRLDVALAARADGAHVGARDLPVRRARELLGPDAILGATARDPGTALLAQADGATYVGVGPAHLTRTKDGLPPPLGPAGVGAVARVLGVPVLAIGGVRVGHVPELLAAGAHGVAVVSALSAAEDPTAAARALRDAIDALACLCPACTCSADECSTGTCSTDTASTGVPVTDHSAGGPVPFPPTATTGRRPTGQAHESPGHRAPGRDR